MPSAAHGGAEAVRSILSVAAPPQPSVPLFARLGILEQELPLPWFCLVSSVSALVCGSAVLNGCRTTACPIRGHSGVEQLGGDLC